MITDSRKNKKKKDGGSFWTSIPGILTGTAALVTAITALYVALHPAPTVQSANPVASQTTAQPAQNTPQPQAATPKKPLALHPVNDNPAGRAIAGDWYGLPDQTPLLMVLRIQGSNSNLSATFQSPCQMPTRFPVDSITLNGNTLRFLVSFQGGVPLHFEGTVTDNKIEGREWQEGVQTSPVTLTRNVLACQR